MTDNYDAFAGQDNRKQGVQRGVIKPCPLCKNDSCYVNNGSIYCSLCPCMAQSDILTIEELIIEWNKYDR